VVADRRHPSDAPSVGRRSGDRHDHPSRRGLRPFRCTIVGVGSDGRVLVGGAWAISAAGSSAVGCWSGGHADGFAIVGFGGAPKEPNRDRLEAYFRLASLDWPLVDGPRKVEAIGQRVAKGAYDLVLVIRTLVAHKESEQILDAAKEARIPWAIVDGYGAASVKQGIDGFLRPPQAR